MNWPGKLFWTWSLRSILHSAIVGAVLGVVWMAVAQIITVEPLITTRAGYALSFLVDTTFVYVVTMIASLSGLALQTWGVVGWVISEGKMRLFQGWILSIFLSLLIGIASRWLQQQGTLYDSLAIMGLSFMLTGMIAWGFAFNTYCIHATMTPGQRREYEGRLRDMVWSDRFKKFFPVFDRNKSGFGSIVAGGVILLSFSLAYVLDHLTGDGQLIPIYMSLFSGLLICLLGFTYRLADTLRPGKNRDRLYPYFEDYR